MSAEFVLVDVERHPDDWAFIAQRAPVLAVTMKRCLAQQAVTLAPSTIVSAEGVYRRFGLWLIDQDPEVRGAADIDRTHVEAFKLKLSTDLGSTTGRPLATNTRRQRLRMLKVFFDRIIDWDYHDAPRRNPIIHGDVPPRPEPLPKFLDDAEMAAFMHQAETEPDPLRKLCVLLLARTGMRVGELTNLPADPVVLLGKHHWLHVPIGKLRTDRIIPLHPELIDLITNYQHANAGLIAATGRLCTDTTSAAGRHRVARMVNRIAKRAGIEHVHPHRLRHTFATQAINRGMRLESVAEMLGHKNLDMTLVYARIANRTVAEEYFNVAAQVDDLYNQNLPKNLEGPSMRRLREEHRRMLGNGTCDRPATMDCHYETICETCTYYSTDHTHVPVLIRQRNHAAERHQTGRAKLYQQLIDTTETGH